MSHTEMGNTKERPILMSAPMVRAILEGRKMQTRRLRGLEEFNLEPNTWEWQGESFVRVYPKGDVVERAWPRECPHGKPGDRLWVRETFLPYATKIYSDKGLTVAPERYVYRADGGTLLNGAKWKPSIFMPRKASRITLEITEVRVQRLQDISDEDAIAEGVEHWVVGEGWREYGLKPEDEAVVNGPMPTARDSYRTLWDSISGSGSWDANPWVWAVSFKCVVPEVRG